MIVCGLVLGSVRPASGQNVVLIIADDVGVDRIAAYGGSPTAGPTPNVDALAAEGVLFRNAWVEPTCSPTRASLLTGLDPTVHGIGFPLDPFNANEADSSIGLDASLWTLPKALSLVGYRSEAFGKWHLLGQPDIDPLHPNLCGFDHFSGFLWGGSDYYTWPKTVDGVGSLSTTYMTTDTADDAIAALGGTEPFFLWVGFLAPHTPWHAPPQSLYTDDLTGVPIVGNEPRYHAAMLEAMDTEMGRILAAVDWSDTTVIFMGDNGTQSDAIEPPYDPTHSKFTVYEGGVNVPLIIAGQAVAPSARGRETNALFQATDLFATVAEIAGASGVPGGSISVLRYVSNPDLPSVRRASVSHRFLPNGGPVDESTHFRSARGDRYKLVLNRADPEEFYDLLADPFEQSPIPIAGLTPEQQSAYSMLHLAVLGLLPPVPNLPVMGVMGRGLVIVSMVWGVVVAKKRMWG